MPDFVYLIHPLREGFFDKPTLEEDTIMEEHFQYHKNAVDNGIVILAGPCLDHTFGIVILKADNEKAANAFMFSDPAVKKNVMMAEIHPMRISLFSPEVLKKQ